MSGSLPEFEVEHIGSDDLVVSSHSVLSSDQVNELVVYLGTVGVPEPATGREHVMREQILRFPDNTVISLGGLLNQSNVVIKLLLGGEGHTIDTLQAVIGGLTQPVGGGVLHYLEGLHSAGHGHMGSRAKIDQVTVLIGSDFPAIWNFTLYQLNLEGVVREQAKSFLLSKDNSVEGLFFGNNFLGSLFNRLIVFLIEDISTAVSIIE